MTVTHPPMVAPSRARGLKRATDSDARGPADRRALTGAWIETSLTPRVRDPACVAPSRARGLKRVNNALKRLCRDASRPHGRVD
ncbi:conserved hypothetical protein [Xanthomonas citri pv. citri]|nr:conserved hypothetical protein [Xanthomonas citri pv. citri]